MRTALASCNIYAPVPIYRDTELQVQGLKVCHTFPCKISHSYRMDTPEYLTHRVI